MKLKNNLLIIGFSLILLLSLSASFASDLDENQTDILLDENSHDTLTANNVIYISPNGTGSGSSDSDPTNWNNAISSAKSGDEIQFLNGTFKNINGNIHSSITLKGSGNTTVDAEKNGGFFTTAAGTSVTIEKLSFINAYTGDKQGSPSGPETGFDGEGAIINKGTLTVNDCYFASNQGIGTEGGAIHNSGTCYIYNSTFYGNGGKKGGALYSDKNSRLYIYNSLVNHCVSREGSALHAKEAYVEIHNCSVVNASAKNGLFYVKKSTIYFYDSYFYNSKAVDSAGVINIDKESSVVIDNCIFDKISSTGTKLWFHDEYGSGDGGAIVVEDSAKNVEIKNSAFVNCTAKGYGGAIYIQSSASITIDNCSFVSNAAEYGSNIYSTRYASRLTITNTIFEIKSTINATDINEGETEYVSVTLDDGTNNLINPSYYILLDNQTEYTVSSQNVAIDKLSNGKHVVSLIGKDSNSNSYVFTNDKAEFFVGENNGTSPEDNGTGENKSDKIASKVVINLISADHSISGILSDVNGNAISHADLKYSMDGKSDSIKTDNSGRFTIQALFNKDIIVLFEGDNQYGASNITFFIEKMDDSRLASQFNESGGLEFTSYAIEYAAGERGKNFTVQLLDSNGSPLANKNILIGYNGKILYRTTDAQGHASVQINLKDANRLTFAVTFLGDDNYNATMSVYLIKIVKKPVTIAAADKTFRSSSSSKAYTVKLSSIKGVSADGKTYFAAGKKVTLKINGKTYTAKTKDNGQATFSLKITQKGTYSAVVSYAGDTTYESATKNVKITIR